MGRTSFSDMTCSIARTAEVIGEWWTPLILRDVALGISRFDVIQRDLGISRKILTQRLSALIDHGVLERVPYQEHPARYDYVLTEKGVGLVGVLLAMQAWGDRWVFGEGAAPVLLRHERCGKPAQPVTVCSNCGESLLLTEITPLPGPGANPGPGTSEVLAVLTKLEDLAKAAG